MLFFTQCFGAVLDLIHLRFQHYKAKRVFAAAGQLVCVVNPTHNLKVSCSLSVLWRSRGSGSSPSSGFVSEPSSRERVELRGKGWSAGSRAPLPRLVLPLLVAGCSWWQCVASLTGESKWSESVSFPQGGSLGVGWGSGVRVVEGVGGVPFPLPNICGRVFRRQDLKSSPNCSLSQLLEKQANTRIK